MQAVRLSDLRDLLQSAPFTAWWGDYTAASAALAAAQARHRELAARHQQAELQAEVALRAAVDTFSTGGEAEEQAARASAEAQAHENRALERVGSFEEQRFRTSDVWYRLGGAERAIEERREGLAAALQPSHQDGARLRAQAASALRTAERQHRALQEEYAAEERKRSRLWDEVEAAWSRSFERSLLAAEHHLSSRRARREAERLFKAAEEQRASARQLRGEVEEAARALAEATRRRAALLAAAGERFGCVAGELFLYWRHREDQRAAFAIALADDSESADLPVKRLAIYTVGRARGVSSLEPAREGLPLTVEAGDRRFEEYFLGPRGAPAREGGRGPAEPEAEEP
jgi:hypothetical protein